MTRHTLRHDSGTSVDLIDRHLYLPYFSIQISVHFVFEMSDSDGETYTIPLRDQRYFGAGLKRKRVQFVPSSDAADGSNTDLRGTDSGPSASERYMSIVFHRTAKGERSTSECSKEQKQETEAINESTETKFRSTSPVLML